MLKAYTAAAVACGILLVSLPPPTVSAQSPAVRVIVNAANPVTVISVAETSDIFLKRATRWKAGGLIRPVDLPMDSTVRAEFCRQVLGRSPSAVEVFWNKQIFSGQIFPPPVKRSEREVLAYVRDNEGAIGYISGSTTLETGVKPVTLTGKQ